MSKEYTPTPNEIVPDTRYQAITSHCALYNEAPLPEATLAMGLIERWGMVAAIPDGEDSAGRQRLRLATPDELTTRAIETVQALYTGLRAAGMIVPLPFTPKGD